MPEYIEKKALIQSFGCNGGHFVYGTQTVDAIVSRINMQPVVDAVEVVRCKDCKHFTKGMAIGMCKRIEDKPIIPIPHNNFCGFGERRSDNE